MFEVKSFPAKINELVFFKFFIDFQRIFLTEMKFRIPMMCWSMIFTDIARCRIGGEGVGGNLDHN